MNVQESYNEWSQSYDADANATRDLDQSAIQRTFAGKNFASIIEIGCGTGKNTLFLAGLGRELMALDFSEGMLAQAKLKSAHLTNVAFKTADITKRWPCPDQSADLVTCNLILEHVEMLGPIFFEAMRVLRGGGQLFVSELHPFRQYDGVRAKFTRGEETNHIPAFTHHISDFLNAAHVTGFKLLTLQEWWHEKDSGKPPRLLTLLFEKLEQR